MSRLDYADLFAADLPEGAANAVVELERLEAACQEKAKRGEADAELLADAQATYARLLEAVSKLPSAPSSEPTAELRVRFAESVLMWLEFGKTSSEPRLDSVGTQSLRAFPLDLPLDEAAFLRIRRALARGLALEDGTLAEAERQVRHLTSALPLKLALTQAIQAQLGAAQPEDRLALLRQAYGDLPLSPTDVDVILTDTGLFFILPIAGEQLDVSDWSERPAAVREQIQAFLQKLARGNLTETWRFPAFGLLEPERMDPSWIDALAEQTRVRRDVVQQTLVTMVSVLPKSEIDQYLVHDAWGHTWQEALNEFEWEYALLRAAANPLSPDDGPLFGGHPTPPLHTAFFAVSGTVQLDEMQLIPIVDADLRGRIQVGLSAALSEVMADFVEAKFSRLNPTHQLPTSSLLLPVSLKFDLTLQDVLRQARRWSSPYRGFRDDPAQRLAFRTRLLALGLPEAGLDAAVEKARQLISTHFATALVPGIVGANGATTVATRALLKLTQLSAALETLLSEAAAHRASPPWLEPSYCPDLWAVSVSHLYESERQTRFWELDALVRGTLRNACDALGDALADA